MKNLFHLLLCELFQNFVFILTLTFCWIPWVQRLIGWSNRSEEIDKKFTKSLLNFFNLFLNSVMLINHSLDKVIRSPLVGTIMEIFCVTVTMLVSMSLGTLLPLYILLVHQMERSFWSCFISSIIVGHFLS